MNVESLNCPSCGAGVASDSTECEFCKTRLKTVACPKCLGLMFVGTKFCGHCGAKAVETHLAEGDHPGNCPRCRLSLELLEIGEIKVRTCAKCDGIWADVETFENICATREQQSAVLGFIGNRESKAEPLAKISYVPCPDCGQLMNRSNFAHASGVIIDICKKDGVWFDAEELPRIIEFIQKGGMEMARQRERMEIESERERLRDQQQQAALFADRSDTFFENEGNARVRSFVRSLFE